MRNRLIILLVLLLGLGADALAAAETAQAQPIPPRGTLYRVRYHDHTSYLFGTIHVGRPDFFPLEPQATQALSEAATLALELDLRDAAAMQDAVQKYGMYIGDDTVDKHLSALGLQRLQAALTQSHIPFERVAHMKTWMIANLLLVAALEQQGYHTDLSTESYLSAAAAEQGKSIVGLESADFQLSLFDSLTEKQQEQYLIDNLKDMQSGEMRKNTQELVDAWASANQKAFNHLLAQAQKDRTTSGKFFIQVLLAKRNPVLADKIEAMIKDQKASFVGIGLLHLIGSNGVPQLLAKRGYTVTKLY
jgi:uncharacterized protein YbaP (TraB family)